MTARTASLRAPTRPDRRRTPLVANVIGTLDRGGAETACLDLCRAVPTSEVRHVFVTVGGREGSLAPRFRAAGADVTQCPLHPVPTFAPRLWRTLRALDPDVVVSHVELISGLVLLVARTLGVRRRVVRLTSEADNRPDSWRHRLLRRTLRRLIRSVATDVVGVSEAALRFAGPPGHDPRYRVLPHAVDVARVDGWDRASARRRWGLPDDVPVLAYLGRAAPEKNRPFLIDVHREVHRLRPDARLLVAGPGGVADITAVHPGAAGDPTIVFAGELDEVGSILAAADALLLPSLREGLPGVLLEALAVGVPVLGSELPSLREAARRLLGVETLPLAAGAGRWAERALAAAATDAVTRARVGRVLRDSPFLLETAIPQWRALWGI
ncbi:glycosyltransferase [Micromonospora sp. RP3T]|uniref:glycosyltransferase n=1 Tax=Micromonospora sp. RP3T TaxID=2135446 RepID=UPI000D16914E|nr:glycosyltransferase [Micromonospora sp. RP3T]PTA46282.1 hypothetical protein C8054_11235 [Micromonospora sp. RP3T]